MFGSKVTISFLLHLTLFTLARSEEKAKNEDVNKLGTYSTGNIDVLRSIGTNPVSINKLLALKFLEDIKLERERKRRKDKEIRRQEITSKVRDKNDTTTTTGSEEQRAEASSDYVSFFDDFENSLFNQDEPAYDYAEDRTTKVPEVTPTTTTTTTSTIRPSQTTSSVDDWQPLFRGSSEQGFGAWLGGVNNRFPVTYSDVQPQFLIPIQLEGGNDIQYIQAKSSSRPENNDKENRSEATGSSKKFSTYRDQETTEIPIIHGIPGDYVEVSLPPPNSIAEVLEPITRVIYKEKTFRDYKTDPEDGFEMYPSKNARSLDGRQNHHYPPRQKQQQQQRHHDNDWRPVADRRRGWRGQRRFGTVGRWRRNAFQTQNPNVENMNHDNFVLPLAGYENSATSRQDFDEAIFSSGIRRPDTFPEFDGGSEVSRLDDSPNLPFEARNLDGESEIRGPQDFYSERGPPPDGSTETGPTGYGQGYDNGGYEPRNNVNPDLGDPNGYDPNQSPEDGQPYPDSGGQNVPTGPGTGPGPGPGPEGGDDGYNNNSNNDEYQNDGAPVQGRGQGQRGGGGGGGGNDDPDEVYFDHDFKPLGGPAPVERIKPRTFFEDFRGFYTSSNDFDEFPEEGGGGGRGGGGRGRGRPRSQPDGFGSFEEDEEETPNYPPPRRPGRRPPPPPPEDYDDGPPPPPPGQGRGRGQGPRNNNGYPDEPPPEDEYPENRPPVYNRNRGNNNYARQYGGRSPQGPPPSGPGGESGPAYGPQSGGGGQGGSRPWGSYNVGISLPQLRTPGRPGGSLNYGYFRRRNNNNNNGGGLFG